MGLKDKLTKYYTDSYLKKYGDRLTQVQGNVLSAKIEEKSILWIFHKLIVTIIVRPERSKSILKTIYKRNRWFKKPVFMVISQGNLVLIQGLKAKKGKKVKKGKENRESIQIMNIRNLTTKKDLVAMDGKEPKVQRIKQKDQRFR